MERLDEYIDLFCDSETGTLKDVIIGTSEQYNAKGDLQPMCEHMKQTWAEHGAPTEEKLTPEYDGFVETLTKNGVNVRRPIPGFAPEQLFTRDIGFVIGTDFIKARMKEPQRLTELSAIQEIVDRMRSVIEPPEGVLIEGGDVIMQNGTIFVGIGQRTNRAGFEFLKDCYGSTYNVVPVPTVYSYGSTPDLASEIDVLHLDCTFMPVGPDSALIFEPGIRSVPKEMRDYRLIPILPDEHKELGTNVLSLNHSSVITRSTAVRVNELLDRYGINVLPIEFNFAPPTGGSVRCSSLPLFRK